LLKFDKILLAKLAGLPDDRSVCSPLTLEIRKFMTVEAITYDDVLLVPSYNHWESRRVVDISMQDRTEKLKLGLPLMTANMDTVTEEAMANFIGTKGGIGVLHRFMPIEENVRVFQACEFPVFVSIGCAQSDLERAEALHAVGAERFCVDVAHAHAKYVGRTLKQARELLGKEACLMVGNVATYAGADYLASCGADIIKVGIGGGSVCTTRIKTGFGVPNLTAIRECARTDRSIVADGGIRTPGDIVKALAFGADFVMVGSMFAGTRPTPGEVLEDNLPDGSTRRYKRYRGMASREVADDHHGGLTEWKTAEGVATEVPYREDEEAIIADIIGGLRSGLTYGGAATIKELQRKLDYVRVTPAGRAESLPHRLL
jgi:IMP dehydrogenase